MTLPVQACSDQELEGYAGVCPEAAVELARRIAAGETDHEAELEDLESQLRQAESELEGSQDERRALRRYVKMDLKKLRTLLGEHDMTDELRTAISSWAKHLEDRI
ncbi:hypothetical protein [Pseudomonas citronellolis]|uniref:hypothetical protein n=1 Tax=Pseudomonas citronellolis TaxID=53408 RepID=UPI0023E3D060|nr:hypothetical protein [Pseudomonas citronellolis]MDF3932114.1 hypothetical protein [Pseudomonas citronellolis]